MAPAAPFGAQPSFLIVAFCLVSSTSGMQDPAGRALATAPVARLEAIEPAEDLATPLVQARSRAANARLEAELDEDLMSLMQTSLQTWSVAAANRTLGAANRTNHSAQTDELANSSAADLEVAESQTTEIAEAQPPALAIAPANSTAPNEPAVPIADAQTEVRRPGWLSLLSRPESLVFTTDPDMKPLRYLLGLAICSVVMPCVYAVLSWWSTRSGGERGAAKALEVLHPLKFDGSEDTNSIDQSTTLSASQESDAAATSLSSEASSSREREAAS